MMMMTVLKGFPDAIGSQIAELRKAQAESNFKPNNQDIEGNVMIPRRVREKYKANEK